MMEDLIMSVWESVFRQSRVNDGYYAEEDLPRQNWHWPKGTWFQSRLDHIRERQSAQPIKVQTKLRDVREMRTI
jgi:hypothetical protein